MYRPYFKVGRKWQHLDSPKFHKAKCAANWAGRFYVAIQWKVLKVRGDEK